MIAFPKHTSMVFALAHVQTNICARARLHVSFLELTYLPPPSLLAIPVRPTVTVCCVFHLFAFAFVFVFHALSYEGFRNFSGAPASSFIPRGW